MSELRGPAGERGKMGDKGYPGHEGRKGEQGDIGVDGVRGPRGVQGTVVLPRSLIWRIAGLLLTCTVAATVLAVVFVGGAVSEKQSRQTCEQGNRNGGYLRYDARYNARLPLRRARLADDVLILYACDEKGRPPLTAAQTAEYMRVNIEPFAKAAGLSPAQFSPEFKRP